VCVCEYTANSVWPTADWRCVYVCVRESVCVCVDTRHTPCGLLQTRGVCVCEREREKVCERVHGEICVVFRRFAVWERERESVCVREYTANSVWPSADSRCVRESVCVCVCVSIRRTPCGLPQTRGVCVRERE